MLTDQIGYYVIDDADYSALSQGITPYWSGSLVFFNVDGKDSYPFASRLYHMLIDSFDKDCLTSVYYNRIKELSDCSENAGSGTGDSQELLKNDMSGLSTDAADFRLYWAYMPKFRILSANDFMQTFSVFLMTFLFICIICLTAAMVIAYTRCQTIAINNRYVFDDLKRLGASPAFLRKEVRLQCGNVFKIPVITGMSAMSLLYGMILFANDGRFSRSEILGFLLCMAVIAVIAALFFGIYVHTLRIVCMELEIPESRTG